MRELHPNIPLWLLCRKGFGDLFVSLGLVDRVIEVTKGDQKSWRESMAKLRKQKFHWIVSPHQSFRTHLIIAQLKADKKIGFTRFFNRWILDHRVSRPMHLADPLRQLSLLAPVDSVTADRMKQLESQGLGVNPDERFDVDLRLSRYAIPPWASMVVVDQVARSPIVMMAPGSVWATKMWTAQGFVETGQALRTAGWQVVLIGSPAESQLCAELASQISGSENWAGRITLPQLLLRMSEASCLVSNDSGSMHLAAMANLPTVSVFGPTVLNMGYRPWVESSIVVQQDLACRPCARHGGVKCPIKTHECMKGLPSARVIRAVESLVGKPSSIVSSSETNL